LYTALLVRLLPSCHRASDHNSNHLRRRKPLHLKGIRSNHRPLNQKQRYLLFPQALNALLIASANNRTYVLLAHKLRSVVKPISLVVQVRRVQTSMTAEVHTDVKCQLENAVDIRLTQFCQDLLAFQARRCSHSLRALVCLMMG
jgi:hypothetical protein